MNKQHNAWFNPQQAKIIPLKRLQPVEDAKVRIVPAKRHLIGLDGKEVL